MEELVRRWYHDRPGAPDGDFSGGRKFSINKYLKKQKEKVQTQLAL